MDNAQKNAQKRVREAGIPPQAWDTTLVLLKQQKLRAIIDNREFSVVDELNSYVVLHSSADSFLSVAFSRFACELALVGQAVLFKRMAGLLKLAMAQESEYLPPFKGYYAVPNFYSSFLESKEKELIQDFLINHVLSGGGLLLAKSLGDLEDGIDSEFSTMLTSDNFKTIRIE